jgi:MFS family permease
MKKSLVEFALTHKRIVSFGMLCALASGFGQTFFISLSVPEAGAEFGLGKAAIGTLYGGATLASAFFLPAVGSRIDRIVLTRFVTGVFLGLTLSALLMGVGQGLWFFAAALFGVRFVGQGLLTHTASTTLSRVFLANRGKALGIASLGYPFSEALFPVAFTSAMVAFGWRGAWVAFGVFAGLVLMPAALWLLRPFDTHPDRFVIEEPETHRSADGKGQGTLARGRGHSWSRREVLMDPRVWLLLPFWAAAPFLLTGFFFHQMAFGAEKSWSALVLASAFVAFAVGRGVTSFLVGPLIDRVGARQLLLFTQLPLALGLLAVGLGLHPAFAWVYLGLSGVSVGLGANTKAAFMIFSTAASPPIFGWLLEQGLQLSQLAIAGAIAIFLAILPGGTGLVMLARSR